MPCPEVGLFAAPPRPGHGMPCPYAAPPEIDGKAVALRL